DGRERGGRRGWPVLVGRRGGLDARALRVAAARESAPMRTALEVVFWVSAGLIVWTQAGYGAALAAIDRALPERARHPSHAAAREELPHLSLIVAAHDEEGVIAARVRNAQALDYPPERLEVIVACDGCSDATAALARTAGAHVVLELPRAGKIRAQDAAVERARGEIVAFSDA